MSVTRIATRYAKSLLELSIDQNKLDAVHADMNTLQAAAQNRDLYLLLKSPIVHADKKNAALKTLCGSKLYALPKSYLNLMVSNYLEKYLPEIAAEFGNQYKILKKITTVRVTSASPLSEAVLADLRRKMLSSGATTENLEIEVKVDPNLIGGFVLEFDNKRYDASAAHKLAELKADFMKNQYIREF